MLYLRQIGKAELMRKLMTNPPQFHLSVFLFGAPQVRLDDHPFEVLRRKNRALVYWIAAHAKPLTRDQVLNCFWPDHGRASGQGVLRSTLHDLRKQLGPALVVEGETLGLAPTAEVDVRRFEQELATPRPEIAALTQTLELYRGDFLQGFSLPDTPQFEDWTSAERDRFRLLAIRGFTTLARLYAAQRDFTHALDALTRALAFDPLQEDLQREALRWQYLSGDRPGAIRRFEALRKLLDEEMGVPPMPETRALYDAIITDTLKTERPVPVSSSALSVPSSRGAAPHASLPFTGRIGELQRLSQTAMHQLAFIEGAPGIGKTRLVQEYIAARPAALVLRGTAHELEQGLPYQPLIEALRGLTVRPEWVRFRSALELEPVWQEEIARLIPELQTAGPRRDDSRAVGVESQMWEALYRFLRDLARQQPVILFLDDLHWADASTLGWLGYLLRREVPPTLQVIATSRSVGPRTPLATLLQTLTREERLVRIELAPLAPGDIRTLAQQLRPTQAASLADRLNRHAEGNPFFIAELVRHAAAQEWREEPGPLDLPPNIHNLILSRVDRVSSEARRVLELAAAVGREFDYGLILRAAGLAENIVLDALDELRVAGLIQTHTGDAFAFDHGLTMQVLLETMGEMRRLALHRRIAQALEEIHSPRLEPVSGLIARHWAEASASARVAPHAFRAGQFAASVAAWTEAIAFYKQALATETDAVRRTDILLALGSTLFNRGDLPQASEALRSAIDLAQAQKDWVRLEQAHLGLNLTQYAQGHYEEAIAHAQELRRSCPPDLAMAAEFMWGMALSLQSTHPIEAESHLREAEKLMAAPRRFPSRLSPAMLKYQLAGALGQQGKIPEAIALYREVLALVRDNQDALLDLQRYILLYNNLAYYLYLEGDPSAAEYARAGLKLARQKGSLTHQPYLLSTSGEIALARNDLDTAQNLFAEGLRLAEELAIPERIAGLTANLGLVAERRGDAELARRQLAAALAQAEKLAASHLATRIRIWLAPLLPSDEARRCLSEARAVAESSGYLRLLDEIAQVEPGLLTRR